MGRGELGAAMNRIAFSDAFLTNRYVVDNCGQISIISPKASEGAAW